MLFKYQVSVITLFQFITISFLGIANGLYSIISTCIAHDECISNALVSIIYFLLIAIWFGFLWVLSYTAQERRSRKLIYMLIAAEGLVALVALFNAKHHPDILGLITSVVDFILALWVILLAFRLMRAKGGRVVVKQPRRRRRRN